ncbi:MAG: type II secretion system major pseudopilin GspG [Puniceicoccaceae bacterium]
MLQIVRRNNRSPREPGRDRRSGKGFTLIEVLLTLALLALLASVVILNVDSIFSGGRTQVAEIWVNQTIKTPLRSFQLHVGRYPSTDEGLGALVTKPESVDDRDWHGPYIEELPQDPWNRDYRYRFPGEKNTEGYDVWSTGPDGTSGTSDDIGNWE